MNELRETTYSKEYPSMLNTYDQIRTRIIEVGKIFNSPCHQQTPPENPSPPVPF